MGSATAARRDRLHHQTPATPARRQRRRATHRAKLRRNVPLRHRRNADRRRRRCWPRRDEAASNAGAQGANANPQPYNRVVTAQAQTKTGFFKTIRIGDRLLFEIPRSQMNKDILLVQEIAQTALGAGYDGQAAGNRVLQFERRENRVLLRGISNKRSWRATRCRRSRAR